MSSMRLSVLIPAYNEEGTVGLVIERVLALPVLAEVIVVDDGSSDRTGSIVLAAALRDGRVRLLSQERNRGKTAAIARALEVATGDIVIVQDADLEYDPNDIPDVIAPILAGQADVVYGSRFLVKRATRVLYFHHFLANGVLTFLSNLFTNMNMSDMETGYKAFRASVIRGIPLTSSGFGMEVEITAAMATLPIRVYEVPISYHGRTYAEGKKIGMRDGIAALYYILYYNTLGVRRAPYRHYRRLVESRLSRDPVGTVQHVTAPSSSNGAGGSALARH
jgi:glycosyltransferase involved in cell wall biosynthesis